IDEEQEPQREILTERPRRIPYNINKYKEVPRETSQVEPEQVVKDTYLSHPNIEEQKVIIDTIWRCIDSRKKGEDFIFNSDNYIKLLALITQEEEKDIEVVIEEQLMRYNSCISKYTGRKKLQEQKICIEKLYRVNKDFVRFSDKLESDIGPDDF
ncbi:MAG: hypothetical protein EZS28_039537, partial [Streblomastix strix]